LLQNKIVKKKASQDLVLVMGPSHNIVGVLIFLPKKKINKRNLWRILLVLPKDLYIFFSGKPMIEMFFHVPKSLKCVSLP